MGMLDKLGGVFAPKPSAGPHKTRECLPLMIFLRNRLKYALTYQEVKKILFQRLIKIDGQVRADKTYPAGFMDVISIERTGENFRLIYDVKGRFAVHRISAEEAKYKLCKVRKVAVKYDIASGKIEDFIKFDSGNLCMITGGRNLGRVGVVTHRERHPGSFDIVHI